MLYVIHGANTNKGKEKSSELVKSLLAKRPGASFFRMDAETFSPSMFDELVSSRGLFEQKYIVELDRVLQKKEAKEYIFERLDDLKDAEHVFILFEEKLLAPELKKLEKCATKIQEVSAAKTPQGKPEKFNVFALTDAFGARDKKGLWVLYRKALMHHVEPEEVHGILLWQVKNMLLVKDAKPADTQEAGLNPFVERKARGFSENYSRSELEHVSSRLVSIFHEARRGKGELEYSLERFILTL